MGWIARSMDTRDNRVTNVRLTEAGQSATEASLPRRNAFMHDTIAVLPDDALNALSGALKMLEARISEVAATASAVEAVAQTSETVGSEAPRQS
jgi:DNA-binding MarR family transcriptional regulator